MIHVLIAGTALALPPAPVETDQLDIREYINVASLRATHSFGTDFDTGAASMSFTNIGAFALLGQYETPGGLAWLPALTYDFSLFNLENTPPGLSALAPEIEDPLHRVDFYNFFIGQNDGWLYGVMLKPGIHSSFESVDSRDFFFAAAAGVGYRFSDSLLLGLSVYGADLTNDPSLIAGPAFLWEINDHWTTFLYGTRFVIRRDLGEDRHLGLEAAWGGGNWSTRFAGQDAQLDYDSARAGLIFRQRLGGDVWLDLGAGYTFGNELRITSPGGRTYITPGLGDAEGSPYVRVGVTVGSW